MAKKPTKRDIRVRQLVAREGVLADLLEGKFDYLFVPADDGGMGGNEKVLRLLYEETVAEMHSLGLEEC